MASAFNDKPCSTCAHFDPVMRGKGGQGGLRETAWAWCARRSLYPAKEGPGQRFPDGVTRVAPGEAAKPVIVRKGQIVAHCTEFTPRGNTPSKADLLKQLQEKSGGRIIGN